VKNDEAQTAMRVLRLWFNMNVNGTLNNFPAEQDALLRLRHTCVEVRDAVVRLVASRFTWHLDFSGTANSYLVGNPTKSATESMYIQHWTKGVGQQEEMIEQAAKMAINALTDDSAQSQSQSQLQSPPETIPVLPFDASAVTLLTSYPVGVGVGVGTEASSHQLRRQQHDGALRCREEMAVPVPLQYPVLCPACVASRRSKQADECLRPEMSQKIVVARWRQVLLQTQAQMHGSDNQKSGVAVVWRFCNDTASFEGHAAHISFNLRVCSYSVPPDHKFHCGQPVEVLEPAACRSVGVDNSTECESIFDETAIEVFTKHAGGIRVAATYLDSFFGFQKVYFWSSKAAKRSEEAGDLIGWYLAEAHAI
jgi:hypothetical protein